MDYSCRPIGNGGIIHWTGYNSEPMFDYSDNGSFVRNESRNLEGYCTREKVPLIVSSIRSFIEYRSTNKKILLLFFFFSRFETNRIDWLGVIQHFTIAIFLRSR